MKSFRKIVNKLSESVGVILTCALIVLGLVQIMKVILY